MMETNATSTPEDRICAVVLGSSRNGSSAVSRLLRLMGVRANFEFGHGKEGTTGPAGDEFIRDAHRTVAKAIGGPATALHYPESLDLAAVRDIAARLETYVADNTVPGSAWGFNDPATAEYLPMWQRIFTECAVRPRYILCVRDPFAVRVSLSRNSGTSPAAAELAWLNRTLGALEHTGLSCFVLHYETLITDPVSVARDLARFVFDGDAEDRIDEHRIRELIRPQFDRSSDASGEPASPLVRLLYDRLKSVAGADFSHEPLAGVVDELCSVRRTFFPWLEQADSAENEGPACRADLRIAKLEGRIRDLTAWSHDVATDNSNLTKRQMETRAEAIRLQQELVSTLTKLENTSNQLRKHKRNAIQLSAELEALKTRLGKKS
jgi:hypothetical protein